MDLSSCYVAGDVATLDCIGPLILQIINYLVLFSGVVALFFLIYSGIKFTSSGGDPKQLEGARKTLTYAVVGLLLVLFSFFILRFIAQVTNTEDRILQFGWDAEPSSSFQTDSEVCGAKPTPNCGVNHLNSPRDLYCNRDRGEWECEGGI